MLSNGFGPIFWRGLERRLWDHLCRGVKNIVRIHCFKNSFFKFNIEDKVLEDKILFIYLIDNQGPGTARNIGAIFSEAENLLFLDAGDMSIEDRIWNQNKILNSNYVSVGAIKEVNSLGISRVKFSIKNISKKYR